MSDCDCAKCKPPTTSHTCALAQAAAAPLAGHTCALAMAPTAGHACALAGNTPAHGAVHAAHAARAMYAAHAAHAAQQVACGAAEVRCTRHDTACGKDKCCHHGGVKYDGPPVFVRLVSQEGSSRLVKLTPPTFAELERYIGHAYEVDDPQLVHADEVGGMYALNNEKDFEHAVRITGKDRYMSVIIKRWKETPAAPCCCCGVVDPGKKEDKKKKKKGDDEMEVITHINDAPEGLRQFLRQPSPFLHWGEERYQDKAAQTAKPKNPMFKHFMPQ